MPGTFKTASNASKSNLVPVIIRKAIQHANEIALLDVISLTNERQDIKRQFALVAKFSKRVSTGH